MRQTITIKWQGPECANMRDQGCIITGARMYKNERPRLNGDKGLNIGKIRG